MKRFFNKKAFTLIETLIAIVVIAVIALPLLSVFLQSVKTDQAAKGVLNSNYMSQDYIEKLDSTNYPAALASLPDHLQIEDYYLSATIEPCGTANSLFSGVCEYAHLVFYSDGTMLAVMPDGNWRVFNSVPNDISFSVFLGTYTFIGDGRVLTGDMDYMNCALLINAMQKPNGTTSNVSLGSTCKSVVYCQGSQKEDITIAGTFEVYSDMGTGETSLVHVTTYVYDSALGTDPKGISESYVNIKNW